MKASTVLSRLKSRNPLFTKIPTLDRKRIIGLETELGVFTHQAPDKAEPEEDVRNEKLPLWLRNGGYIYFDQQRHVETCTPETTNPLSVVMYKEACLRRAHLLELSKFLAANNCDADGSTFGFHENYFTKMTSRHCGDFREIAPFLAVRSIINGTGTIDQNLKFHISQRARFIQRLSNNNDTTHNRPLVGTRVNDHNTDVDGLQDYRCAHLISGDTNRCPVATFLTVGLTSLVLGLYEDDKLPKLDYDYELAPEDLQEVSLFASHSLMDGSIPKLENLWIQQHGSSDRCLRLLRKYLDCIRSAYEGRDDVTDAVIYTGYDTLVKLESNPLELVGRLDWITKWYLLKLLWDEGERDFDVLHRNDVSYHSLNPEYSIFYFLMKTGKIERLYSNKLLHQAEFNPPTDTRAYARGKLVSSRIGELVGKEKYWDRIRIMPRGPSVKANEYLINNPFCNYAELAEEILSTWS